MKNVMLELHLSGNPDLPKKFGARIKAVGGRYNAVRGYGHDRYVTIPATETALADALIKNFAKGKGTCIIWRGPGSSSQGSIVVHPDWTPKVNFILLVAQVSTRQRPVIRKRRRLPRAERFGKKSAMTVNLS